MINECYLKNTTLAVQSIINTTKTMLYSIKTNKSKTIISSKTEKEQLKKKNRYIEEQKRSYCSIYYNYFYLNFKIIPLFLLKNKNLAEV